MLYRFGHRIGLRVGAWIAAHTPDTVTRWYGRRRGWIK